MLWECGLDPGVSGMRSGTAVYRAVGAWEATLKAVGRSAGRAAVPLVRRAACAVAGRSGAGTGSCDVADGTGSVARHLAGPDGSTVVVYK